MMRTWIAILLLSSLIAAPCATADRPDALPPGMGKYLVVLWESGTPVPGGKPKDGKEPDFAKLGGRLLHGKDNRRVIVLPLSAARELRRHESVVYLQRLWTEGESLKGWAETYPHDVRTLEAEGTLTWGPKDYAYDGSGNITAAGGDHYTYDTAGRLIEAQVSGKTETYKYDSFGNLYEKAVAGGTPDVIAIDSGTNRIEGAGYDVAGNVMTRGGGWTYEWDSAGMLWRIQKPNGSRRILYDANDERIGTIIDSALSRWQIRDVDGQIIREYKGDRSGDNLWWFWEQDHVRAGGQLVAGEMQEWTYGGSTPTVYGGDRHYHLDHLGSVRLVTNDAGKSVSQHDYYPFGLAKTLTYQEQINLGDPHIDGMRFAGHWRDFLGLLNVENTEYLDYMHARYYDPRQGRFLSVDPLLDVKRSTREPQSWNRYSYVINNPINRIDPDGRMDGNGMGEPAEWRCPGCTRAEQMEQSNQIAAGTAKGAAISLSLMAGGAGAYAFATNAAFRFAVLLNMTGIGIGMTGGAVGGSGQIHHIATNKNIAGGFTKQFEAIFAKAGMKLGDSANLMNLAGHAGRHSPGYHRHVLDTLQKATHGLSGKAYKDALTGALGTLRKELEANPDLVRMR